MYIFLHTIIFATLSNGVFGGSAMSSSSSSPSSSKKPADNFNIDKFRYKGDPIYFMCITTDSQREFYVAEVNGSIPSALVDRLDNEKGLSLLFHGVENIFDSVNESFSPFANEWFEASGNNICIVSYTYVTNSSTDTKMNSTIGRMVKTRRLEYVAKMARDLVLDIGEKCATSTRNKCVKNLSHVDVTGFGFGAHIAGYTCEYLFKKTGGKVRLLLALDPIKPALRGIRTTIKRRAADYVQVIHTSIKVGMWNQTGDVDIYVKYESDENLGPLNDVHGIAFFIHLATSTKRLFIMAEMNNNTKPGIGKVLNSPTNIEPNECLIGVHGTLNVNHRGKRFGLLLKNGDPIFWRGVGNFKYIISGLQEVEEEDEDCILCYENKKNALLLPCRHMETCVTCWFEWENAQTSDRNCPICRREVKDFKEVNKKNLRKRKRNQND